MIALGIVFGYLLLGVGTARAMFARRYKWALPYWQGQVLDHFTTSYGDDPHKLTIQDPDVCVPTVLCGLFWPATLIWLLVLRPIGTVVVPMFLKWFMAPALRRVETEVK